MATHKRFGEKSKLPANLKIGDIIPYSSSVNGKDLIKMLREKGYEAKHENSSSCNTKAFGYIVITSAI
jgi:hypothetical protein